MPARTILPQCPNVRRLRLSPKHRWTHPSHQIVACFCRQVITVGGPAVSVATTGKAKKSAKKSAPSDKKRKKSPVDAPSGKRRGNTAAPTSSDTTENTVTSSKHVFKSGDKRVASPASDAGDCSPKGGLALPPTIANRTPCKKRARSATVEIVGVDADKRNARVHVSRDRRSRRTKHSEGSRGASAGESNTPGGLPADFSPTVESASTITNRSGKSSVSGGGVSRVTEGSRGRRRDKRGKVAIGPTSPPEVQRRNPRRIATKYKSAPTVNNDIGKSVGGSDIGSSFGREDGEGSEGSCWGEEGREEDGGGGN